MNKVSKHSPSPVSTNAFDGLADVLVAGFDTALSDDAYDQMVALDDIEIRAQDREEFEDHEHSLADLGESLQTLQLQSILLRPTEQGSAKPFLLVAGERRVRAARLKGMTQLRARIKPMTDEQAKDAQFVENIHRKNLTQLEEAQRVQRDLDHLGSVDAVLAKYKKSRSWLSKITALLQLPVQTNRLVREHISADLEVISTVKTIERANPARAAALVDELKARRGKSNARELATAVKDEVKPKKRAPKRADEPQVGDATGSVATPPDRTHERPGPVSVFEVDATDVGAVAPELLLAEIYRCIVDEAISPGTVVEALQAAHRDTIENALRTFYELGKHSKDAGRAVIQGIRHGEFAGEGAGAFALVAFLHGADGHQKFNLLNILGCVKP